MIARGSVRGDVALLAEPCRPATAITPHRRNDDAGICHGLTELCGLGGGVRWG